jgi:hypothetical protein
MDVTCSESRIKLALRVLKAISVDCRFPDRADSDALRSLAGSGRGRALDEVACEVIVREVRRMRALAELRATGALDDGQARALEDCA